MGKKDKDKKKKGKGAEKTLAKTEKKLSAKLKKELALKGEDDIETILKKIESEEKKRKEVKESKLADSPSHRSNFTLSSHPDHPELWIFGGEFYNGKQTLLNSDLLIYNVKRKEWSQIQSPGGPPPRSSHQSVILSSNGGQFWTFGGEYVSPSESQFYHYKDLWVYHMQSKRWEKVAEGGKGGGPTSRSGHRMLHLKRHLFIFGGFHDNLRECKYFDDIHAFDTESRTWKNLEITGKGPSPRSGCLMFTAEIGNGRSGIVIYGGYCKEKKKNKKDQEQGNTLSDMYILSPDKHDETMTKWRWQVVKQVGSRPSVRSGMSVTVLPGSGKIFTFGGVQDQESQNADGDDDDDDSDASFFNDLHTVSIENEKATWSLINLTGKRKRKTEEEKEEEQEIDDKRPVETKTVTVEEGAFTITSTLGSASKPETSKKLAETPKEIINSPSPRFGAGLTSKHGSLYLYGGLIEDDEDRQITLKDFYSLDTHKFDEWETIIKSDVDTMEWFDSDDDDEDSSDSDSENSDCDEEMDTK